MSIEINCKDQRVEDIMRDVKEKSESVIYAETGCHRCDEPCEKSGDLSQTAVYDLIEL